MAFSATPCPLNPPRTRWFYGCIPVSADNRQVLLRQPSGDPDGRCWTFSRGLTVGGESPEDCAVREASDHYGQQMEILQAIPRWFCDRRLAVWYYLAHCGPALPSGPNWETSATAWHDWETAARLVSLNPNPDPREKDLQALAAARCLVGG